MAKAFAIPTQPQRPALNLELSPEESQVLIDILGRIGGGAGYTRRGLADGIATALINADPLLRFGPNHDVRGEITFSENK